MEGTRLGRYQLVSRLGAGSFATVWLADDPALETPVAVKILRDQHVADSDVRERFLQEARLMRRLRSEHLVGIYDLGATPAGLPYVVMELAGRGSLSARLTRLAEQGVPVTPGDLEPLAEALVRGLSTLHDHSVVHRDVKPSNTLLCTRSPSSTSARTGLVGDDEVVALGDLGLAKVIRDGPRSITIGGGTIGYAAPEQLVPNSTVDHRADVFGASATLYAALLGAPPGPGAEPRPVGGAQERRLVAVLDQGLHPDPRRRHQSIQAWGEDVRRALRQPTDRRGQLARAWSTGSARSAPTERVSPLPPPSPARTLPEAVASEPDQDHVTARATDPPRWSRSHSPATAPWQPAAARTGRRRVAALLLVVALGIGPAGWEGSWRGREIIGELEIVGPAVMHVGDRFVFSLAGLDERQASRVRWRMTSQSGVVRGERLAWTADSAGVYVVTAEIVRASGIERGTYVGVILP